MTTSGTQRRLAPRRLARAVVGLTAVTVASGLISVAPASAQVTGNVVLFADINFSGATRSFGPGDYSNIGTEWNDRASSIMVPVGTLVSVYEHGAFGGRCENFRVNDSDLRNNPIGQDSITSLRVGRACPQRLWDDPDYGGSFQSFVTDIPDLGAYGFSDRAEAVQLAPGNRVALFDQPNYQGLCEVITADDQNFDNNPIRQRASSLRLNVDCPPQRIVFADINYGGDYLVVDRTYSLTYWPREWLDRVSSVHVTASCIYAEHNWQEDVVVIGVLLRWFKASERFYADDPDLRNNVVGSDSIDYLEPC